MPAMGTRGAAREEEQRHDLHDPRDQFDRGQRSEQVADAQAVGVDGGEQQGAMAEHHDDQCGEPGDIDGAIAAGRGVVGDLGRLGAMLGERHPSSMPGGGPSRMSRTTRPGLSASPESHSCASSSRNAAASASTSVSVVSKAHIQRTSPVAGFQS